MNKLLKTLTFGSVAALAGVSLVACSSDDDEYSGDTITITSLNAEGEAFEHEVAYKPERVAMLDLAAMDIVDYLGEGDSIVGAATTSIDYLADYENVKSIGNIKTPDLEAVMEVEPQIIFIGGRLKSYYAQLEEIAPVVYLATNTELGVVESTYNTIDTIATIYGKGKQSSNVQEEYNKRIDALKDKANSSDALVGMCTGGKFNLLGNDGRCSIIGTEIGFNNLSTEYAAYTSAHGETTSWEYVAAQDPEWIFCMDRDAAIGTEGATPAADILNNAYVNGTRAGKNNHVVVLEHSNVWYTAEGGIQALGIMLSDLESVLA